MTCADYAYNPRAYDPARSIGQAILHVGETQQQRQVLKDLVEAYCGMLLYGKGTGFNSVRDQYTRLSSAPHGRFIARMYIDHFKSLSARMEQVFPGRFKAEKQTLNDDIAGMEGAFAEKYGPAGAN
jgi:hypothetical protein